MILRAENDNLKNENYRLQAVLRSLVCPGCGGSSILGELEYDEQHLRVENARLKEEVSASFDRFCTCFLYQRHSITHNAVNRLHLSGIYAT